MTGPSGMEDTFTLTSAEPRDKTKSGLSARARDSSP